MGFEILNLQIGNFSFDFLLLLTCSSFSLGSYFQLFLIIKSEIYNLRIDLQLQGVEMHNTFFARPKILLRYGEIINNNSLL